MAARLPPSAKRQAVDIENPQQRRPGDSLPSRLFGTAILAAIILLAFLGMAWQEPVIANAWLLLLAVYVASNAMSVNRATWLLLFVFTLVGGAAVSLGVNSEAAVRRAGLLTALLGTLALLGRIAVRSPDVLMAARLITSRPPGMRYIALTLGTHMFSVFLNFGAVLLMTTLLSTRRVQLERDRSAVPLTLAVLRGFAAMPFWSPLALSVIITLSIVPAVRYGDILPAGLAAAASYMLAGYLMDGGRSPRQDGLEPARRDEVLALCRVVARLAALIACTFAILGLLDIGMAESVLAATTLTAAAWLLAQILSRPETRIDVLGDFAEAGRSMVNETIIVAGAAFVGSVSAGMLLQFSGVDTGLSVAGAAVLAGLLPALMVGAGSLALNPIITASVALGSLQAVWPSASLHWLVLSAIAGWGITASGAPFTASILIAGRIMQRSTAELAFRDNGRLTAAALIVAGCACATAVLAIGQGR